jgi:hypothetical protein
MGPFIKESLEASGGYHYLKFSIKVVQFIGKRGEGC